MRGVGEGSRGGSGMSVRLLACRGCVRRDQLVGGARGAAANVRALTRPWRTGAVGGDRGVVGAASSGAWSSPGAAEGAGES